MQAVVPVHQRFQLLPLPRTQAVPCSCSGSWQEKIKTGHAGPRGNTGNTGQVCFLLPLPKAARVWESQGRGSAAAPPARRLGGEVAAAAGASSPGSTAAGTAGPAAASALAGGFRRSCLASSLWASPQCGKKVWHPWFELWEMGVSMRAGPAGSRDNPEPTHP